MVRPSVRARFAFASGAAGAAGAAVILAGRAEGSVLLVAALCVAGRAAAGVSSVQPSAARALSRSAAMAPVWVGLAIVSSLRSGSTGIEAARGSNAVLGLAVAHGPVAMVIATLLACAACLVAVSASWARLEHPSLRLEIVGVALQVWLVVSVAAGPQVRRAMDVIPWAVGSIVAVAGTWASLRFARSELTPKVVNGLAVVAVLVALFGGRA